MLDGQDGSVKQGRLKRDVGFVVVALSALSQEYGSGINFVMPHSLGRYPAVESLVPWAMLIAGLLLIPKVFLFCRYSAVMPRAGSTHVWLTRSAGPYLGFVIAFLWFVGICGAIGFLAFASATFVADALHAAGLTYSWAVSRWGHLLIGLAAIWIITGVHLSGVKNYGYIVYAAGILVIIAAAIVIITGFTADSHNVVRILSATSGLNLAPAPAHPSLSAFISTMALFMFAYGGLTAACSLGGETVNPTVSMPKGIVGGWAAALILYTLVAFGLFHAVPWWAAVKIASSHHAYLLTAPALIGLVQVKFIAVFLNLIVALVVIKTIAPQLLDASRYIFAWSEDCIIHRSFCRVNARQVPELALLVTSGIGSLFLIDAVFAGWAIGVIVRAASVAATFAVLGLGTLLLSWWPKWRQVHPFAEAVTKGVIVKILSIAALVIGIGLITFVVYKSGKPLYFQPWFQILIAVIIALILLWRAIASEANRTGVSLAERLCNPPLE